MKKLLWTLSVIALASCGGDDDNAVTPQPEKPRMLTVVVNENPLQDENASAREGLRRTAAATTTASLSPFKMNTEDWDQTFTKESSSWTTVSWAWDHATKITFFAHKDADSFNWNNGDPYVSFTMDENAFKQKDLLVAKTTAAYNDHNGQVYLTFDHACAAVQFNVYKEEAADYVVKSIILQNVKKTGEYHYSDNSWKSVSGTTFYTLTNTDITVTTGYQLLPCQWLFVIPQSKEGLTLEVTYSKGGAADTTKSLTLDTGSWAAGKKYTVNIRIGKAAPAAS